VSAKSFLSAAILTVVTLVGSAAAARPPAWPDTPLARLQAFAAIQSLNADLLSHDSATLVLEAWCSSHRLAAQGHVIAERKRDVTKPATSEIRRELGADDAETIAYRRVRLRCGDEVLSEADNWYVPSRLTPEMNRTLENTDVSFGRVVQPLHFVRRTVSAETPWEVLPPDWAVTEAPPKASGSMLIPPDVVLRHKAILTLPGGAPFSLVVESYTAAVIAFPQPRLGSE
jgi:chorismate-pyruvate lyase